MKRITAILLFYLINFGLWEILSGFIPGEWDSFLVYVILFLLMVLMFRKDLKGEWKSFAPKLKSKAFIGRLFLWLVLDLVLTELLLLGIQKFGWDILPQNNSNVKEQMAAVPVYLAVLQGCVFAPFIEELVFRFAIIGRPAGRKIQLALAVMSVVLFDVIHIVRAQEFFYYLIPAVFLTTFYTKEKNPWASMMLHSMINIVGYAALLVGVI